MDDYPFIATWNLNANLLDEEDALAVQKREAPATRSPKRYLKCKSKPAARKEAASAGVASSERVLREVDVNITARNKHNASQKRTIPTAGSKFKYQSNSPAHLAWLSQVSRLDNLMGSYYNFDEVLYDDPDNRPGQPTVYVIDSSFLNTHQVRSRKPLGAPEEPILFTVLLTRRPSPEQSFASRVREKIAVDITGHSLAEQQDASASWRRSSHGTCMTSLIAGQYHSVAKRANIVTVQLDFFTAGTNRERNVRRAILVFREIRNRIIAANNQGNAVVSMSFGNIPFSPPHFTAPYGQRMVSAQTN